MLDFFSWFALYNFCFKHFLVCRNIFFENCQPLPAPCPTSSKYNQSITVHLSPNERRHQSKIMVTQLTLISVTHSVMTLSFLALTTFLHKRKILLICLLQCLIAFLRVIPDGVGQVGTRYLTLGGLNT